MLNLIRKDLLLHKTGFPFWATVFVVVLAFQAWRGFSPSFYLMLACAYGTIFPAMLVTLEDKSRSGPFNCSLPVTRRQIVRAKYVISWALAVLLTLIGLVLYAVIAAESLLTIWTMAMVGQALVTLSLGLGMTIPVLLRFGFWGFTGAFAAMMSLCMLSIRRGAVLRRTWACADETSRKWFIFRKLRCATAPSQGAFAVQKRTLAEYLRAW